MIAERAKDLRTYQLFLAGNGENESVIPDAVAALEKIRMWHS
jgi:hypothetical protein